MITEKFRRQLRQEAQLWREEELITERFYQQLTERYQFNHLDTAASSRFVMILIGLGGVLLGLAVITFVAANWQNWSRELKVILLLSLFVAVNTTGFYLWQQPQTELGMGRKRRLGEGLLIFGALSLGANLALMSQMFHQSGSSYELFLIWGLGVIAMAWGLSLTSLGFLGILLYGMGYWIGHNDLFILSEFSFSRFLLEHTALLIGLLFIPLAYRCQSRVLFVMALLVLIPALQISLLPLLNINIPASLWFALSGIFTPLLLWGYNDSLFLPVQSRPFQPLARTVSIVFLAILFFWFSFNIFWAYFPVNQSDHLTQISNWVLIDFVFYFALILLEWYYLAKPSPLYPKRWGFDSITSVLVGFFGVTAILCFWHLQIYQIPEIATFLFNVQLFLLGAGLIRIGLEKTKRLAFWGGMILLVSQIMSRTFEYNTELVLKAFVFGLCGIGVILAGLWFERHLSAQKS